jgi:hypothetical protein
MRANQSATVAGSFRPVSTSTQPSRVSMVQTLMWSSRNGIDRRIQRTPGASSTVWRGAGGSNG